MVLAVHDPSLNFLDVLIISGTEIITLVIPT